MIIDSDTKIKERPHKLYQRDPELVGDGILYKCRDINGGLRGNDNKSTNTEN